jgi:hypothetical protein
MRGLLFGFLVVVTLVFGASYASAILFSFMGPFSAVGIEQDGSQTHMAFGQNLARPEWVPVYPGASIVQASKVTAARSPSGFHSLEVATRASLDEVKRFYTEQLTASGFTVTDLGIAPLNPATARMLGMDGTISAKRAATDDFIYVQIRTPDGLIPSRMLQIRWAKISEYPQHAAAIQSDIP